MAAPTNPAPPPPSTPSRVSRETVEKAIDSLLTWRETRSEPSNPNLHEEDEFLYVVLNLKNAPPKGRTNPFKIPLPHPLHAFDSSKLCLLIDDRPKSSLTREDAEKKIEEDQVPVSKVLTLTDLRSNCRSFDAKRKLCDSYDAFVADKRIVPSLPNLLGRVFSKKKKSPVPVDLTHKNWKEQIGRVCGSAVMFLKEGAFIVLKAGRVPMAREENVENVMAAIEGAAEVVPESWGNVRSFHVKLAGSEELPVYQAVKEVKVRIGGIRAKEEGGDGEVAGGGEVAEESKVGKKKKASKKGRINEVQNRDSVGEVVDDGDDKNDDLEMGEGENGEAEEGGKGRKTRKKGRIHEVQYMDSISEVGGDKNDDLEMGDGENGEADDMSCVGKKRKKDGKVKRKKENGDDSEIVDSKKRKDGKAKSTENGKPLLKKARKDELAVKGGEEHGIKRDDDVKTKNKSSGKKMKGKTKKRILAAE